ncbi:alpha-2-macroglobulin family protein [Swingsia samuiensis]|nr:MG2 domain-containing protein [Swingsia samuiensis]
MKSRYFALTAFTALCAFAPFYSAVAQRQIPASSEQTTLGFVRLTLNTGGERPEACLRFDQTLDSTAVTHYADHVTVTPQVHPALRVEDHDLCIGGLAWGTRYRIAVSPGMADAHGNRLSAPVSVSVMTGDRKAQIAMGGAGYILPKRTASGIDIQTVNMDRVRVAVWRMSQPSIEHLIKNDDIDLAASSVTRSQLDELRQTQLTKVWSGTLDVDNVKNIMSTKSFPLAGVVQGQKAGIYLVTAEDAATPKDRSFMADASSEALSEADIEKEIAAHWVKVSDMGLSAIRGSDGLHVFARSLATAEPMVGIKISLTSRGSDELGTVTTDDAGQAVFASGLMNGKEAETPSLILATAPDGDTATIRVDGSWFDLSDRGVDGHETSKAQQAVLVTDRGIYRPGETVNITALLRDHKGEAISSQPLILALSRPDGVEVRRVVLPAQASGGFVTTEQLTSSAPHGRWTISAYSDPTLPPIGTTEISVQDFVPQTLGVKLTSTAKAFPTSGALDVVLDGQYLYGAPAAGLHGDGRVKISLDDAPIAGFDDYSFGLNTEHVSGDEQKLSVPDADAQGRSVIAVHPDIPQGLSLPLKATITASMQDPAGRSVAQTLTMPLTRTRPLIGLKVKDSGGGDDQQAVSVPMDVVTFGPDNKPQALHNLAWSIVRENEVYDWIHDDGRWSFREHVIDEPVQHGATDTGSDGRAHFAPALVPARYRLIVSDPATGSASSREFYVGWWSAGDDKPNAPDRLVVTPKDKTLAADGTTTVHIDAPFAGQAQIVMATDRVESVRNINVPKGGVDVPVTASADWAGGAYMLVTLYRSLQTPARAHEPTRAVGVAYIGLDQSAHRLGVSIDAPKESRPQGKMVVPVTITGGKSGPVHVTLAAVDKGILGLTAWKQPDVFDLIYGRRELGVDVTDTYAHLLSPTGTAGTIHEGGDVGSGEEGDTASLAVTSTHIVSLFSGDVTPDANGHAQVALNVPDFEGTLGLMGTAWRDDAVGTGQAETIVRDPVFADLTLPRFMAPGDTATSLVSLVNTDGEAGHYTVSLTVDGPLTLPQTHDFASDLAKGERKSFSTVLTAHEAGIAHLHLALHDKNGKTVLTRSWDIQIRSGHMPLTTSVMHKQASGESYTVDPALLDSFEPGAALTLSYSGVGGIDTVGLLQSLESFSWGSSESLASAARPLLLFKGHKQLGLETIPGGPDKRVQDAIAALLDREDEGGRIGDWRLNDGGTLPWTQIYLVDFLSRAKAAGYAVPDAALGHALDWLETEQGQGNGSDESSSSGDIAVTPESKAYALYVLARAGRLNTPALRALYDNVNTEGGSGTRTLFWGDGPASDKTRADALALGHLAGGLALAGQHKQSDDTFGMAVDALGPTRVGRPGLLDFEYWTYVRDLAGLTPLAAESGNHGLAQKLADRFSGLTLGPAELSDESKMDLLETVAAMNQNVSGVGISVNGHAQPQPLQLPFSVTPKTSELKGFTVSNSGSIPLWLAVTVTGSPKDVSKPITQGFNMNVSTRGMHGEPVDVTKLRQNDRFIVVIEGNVTDHDQHHCVLVDMLPAGWEIEGLAQGKKLEDDPENQIGAKDDTDTKNEGYDFLGVTSDTRFASIQDDRFVAAFDLSPNGDANSNMEDIGRSSFRVAYIVRAVTPGTFLRPETVVKDQYRPTMTARSAAGVTTITAR